jgi:hypothetical protein
MNTINYILPNRKYLNLKWWDNIVFTLKCDSNTNYRFDIYFEQFVNWTIILFLYSFTIIPLRSGTCRRSQYIFAQYSSLSGANGDIFIIYYRNQEFRSKKCSKCISKSIDSISRMHTITTFNLYKWYIRNKGIKYVRTFLQEVWIL